MDEDVGLLSSEEKKASVAFAAGSLCPMYFGLSCAFMALNLLSRERGPDLDSARRCRLGEMLLDSSARLLGLLVWRSQRGRDALEESLRAAESEVSELKRLRAEDAKANEKVAVIFASREQSWIAEKKKFKIEAQALLSQFRMLEAQKEEALSHFNSRVEEKDGMIRSKEDALEEEIRKRTELEEKLHAAEEAAEESWERARKEAQDHASELWRHKTAFAELVSNHRQLEPEMGRALRQVEAARQELDEAFKQKEEALTMAEKLSEEIAKMQKDAEQKGKVLSAMLRKSKLDAAEKQVLLKEVKMSKTKEKQAELEVERLRSVCEPWHHWKGPQFVEAESSRDRREDSLTGRSGFHRHRALLLDYLQADSTKNSDCGTPERGGTVAGSVSLDQFSSKDSEEELASEAVTSEIRQLQDWVHSEIENCASFFQQRHDADIEAFTEQMMLKEEKLEAYRWRALSMELESKRLHSHIEGLDGDLSRCREESVKLEALLLEKEEELKSLRQQFSLHMRHCRKSNATRSATSPPIHTQAPWSEEVRVGEREVKEGWQEQEATSDEGSPPVMESLIPLGGDWKGGIGGAKQRELESERDREENIRGGVGPDSPMANSAASSPSTDRSEVHDQHVEEDERRDCTPKHEEQGMAPPVTSQAPQEEKEVSVDPSHAQLQTKLRPFSGVSEVPNKTRQVPLQSLISRDSPWKVDLHALGVSYKIKRLRQQLLVLEKLAGAPQEAAENPVMREKQPHGFFPVISVLSKQVKRYQILEEKADVLCKRMQENDRPGRTKEQTGGLEFFLEEAFQLQRHIVGTGQKLVEVQSALAGSVAGGGEDGLPPGFNARQFADVARTLFREIQRGFEVRVARMIGSLEGTLASEGILHIRS